MQGLAYDLATRLPRIARALREGVIDAFKAQIIAEATRVLDDAGAAAAGPWLCPMWRARIRARSGPSSGGPC